MALQVEISAAASPIGMYLPSAYARIASVTVVDSMASLTVITYADDVAYEAGAQPVKTETFVNDAFDQAAPGNLKETLYAWLKTLPVFQTATDYP